MYLLVSDPVITEGFGVQATTIKGQNAFAQTLCFAQVSCDRWSNMHDLLQVIEVANSHDQIAFHAFHSFLMEA